MGDTRTDPGQYYPGGRVVARRDVSPQEIVVQWSDVQGKPQIAPLPDRYRESDMKGKINEIASKFATALAVALVGWTALAGLVVQKAPKENVWNDEEIVTNAYLTGENASGAVRTLPKYLWIADFDDSYPADAEWYYRQPQDYGHCSSVRDGNTYSRNLDWKFNSMAEVIIRMSAGPGRFASLGVANVGTNLTEEIIASGAPTRYVKALPGHTVDGINENGVVCNVNVVDGDPHECGWPTNGTIHCLGVVRWVLDNATNAASAASVLASEVYFPSGFGQNFHWMIADETSTYIVENGTNYLVTGRAVMTNFRLYPTRDMIGEGQERYDLLLGLSNITNAWYTRAYLRSTTPYWYSEFHSDDFWHVAVTEWAKKPKEEHRGETFNGQSWWQTVHTSVYDLTNRTLRICVQETDDWYVFAVPSAGGVKPDAVREIVEPMVAAATNAIGEAKRDKTDLAVYGTSGNFGILRFVGAGLHHEDGTYEWNETRSRWEFNPEEELVNYLVAGFTNGTYTIRMYWYRGDFEGEWTGNVIGDRIEIDNEYGDKSVFSVVRDRLATTNGVAAAIEAKVEENEGTGTFRQIVRGRYDEDEERWQIAVDFATTADFAESAYEAQTSEQADEANRAERDAEDNNIVETYARKDELAAKRDHTDNVCVADGFGEWTLSDSRYEIRWFIGIPTDTGWALYVKGASGPFSSAKGGEKDTSVTFKADWDFEPAYSTVDITATRSRVCTSNELFVTQGYVTNSIATLAPAPGNYAAVSNAAMNAIQAVTNADANLIYTITSDGAEPRFYFTPVGAINAED